MHAKSEQSVRASYSSCPGDLAAAHWVCGGASRAMGPGEAGFSRANSGARLPRDRLDRPDSQACTDRSKGNRIRCIRSARP